MPELFLQVAQGSNPRIKITVKDKDGTPRDLSLLDGYALSVFQKPDKPGVVFAKDVPSGSNWEEFDNTDDEEDGEIYIVLPQSFTSEAKGNYYVEFLQQATDGSYVAVRKNPGGKEFITVVESSTRKFTAF